MKNQQEWFATWFNSPFYHILYKNRDEKEAQVFMNQLTTLLDISPQAQILDLACGKGRHSIYLNQLGFQVTGIDLAEESIRFAQQFSNERLQFFVHDMREEFALEKFHYIFNLFTSFGYFQTDAENIKAIQAAAKSLKKGGIFVLDFFNTALVLQNLPFSEEKKIDGIDFKIDKKLENGFILKNIHFEHSQEIFHFQEKVQALSKIQFLDFFAQAELQVRAIYGNYNLDFFDESHSPRMIFVLQK